MPSPSEIENAKTDHEEREFLKTQKAKDKPDVEMPLQKINLDVSFVNNLIKILEIQDIKDQLEEESKLALQ